MTSKALAIALAEASIMLRGRWVLAYSVSFFLIAVSLTQFTVLGVAGLGLEAVGRLTASIVNITLYLVSLVSLILSSLTIVSDKEQGSLEWLCSEPVNRTHVVSGKFLALLFSVSLTTILGYSLASWVLSLFFPLESVVKVMALTPALILLIAVCISVGLLTSVRSRSRVSSLGIAFGIWLLIIFLYDLAVVTLSLRLELSETQVFMLAIANPLESTRLLLLYIIDPSLTMLGRTGALLVRSLGQSLPIFLLVTLVIEAIVFYTMALILFRRTDVV